MHFTNSAFFSFRHYRRNSWKIMDVTNPMTKLSQLLEFEFLNLSLNEAFE